MKKKKNQAAASHLPKRQVTDVLLSGITGGCGGMTQIDPPSLQIDAGASDSGVDSAIDELP